MSTPLTVVVFGATGDLFKKKLAEAFFYLYKDEYLNDNFVILGFSRKEFTDEGFREYVRGLVKTEDKEYLEKFVSKVFYRRGDTNERKTYEDLKNELLERDESLGFCSNKLFYLAVVPELYETIFRNLSHSGLTIPCAPERGGREGAWIRILVEKPFGKNQIHAEMLDQLLGSLFLEEQIFRIDHYLAKETVQNILAFRFGNSLFEPLWSRKHIKEVNISVFEENDIKGRGSFYDSVGALKDFGQNHLLQLLALVAMENPYSLDPDDIREARADVLEITNTSEEIDQFQIGQYEGYVGEAELNNESDTETYFKCKLEIENERWKNVPFFLSHGKALSETKAEIEIVFNENEVPDRNFFPKNSNRLVFHIQPKEGISIEFFAKKTGDALELEKRVLSFEYGSTPKSDSRNPHIDPYKKLLVDALVGDQTLFVSTDEIKEEWRIIGEVEKVFNEIPFLVYKKGASVGEIGEKFYAR